MHSQPQEKERLSTSESRAKEKASGMVVAQDPPKITKDAASSNPVGEA
jgi:hypothetical protein